MVEVMGSQLIDSVHTTYYKIKNNKPWLLILFSFKLFSMYYSNYYFVTENDRMCIDIYMYEILIESL